MEPEIIELNGYKLAIPMEHPAFYKTILWGWCYAGQAITSIIWDDVKRQCAAEAFAYWVIKARSKKAMWGKELPYLNFADNWKDWGDLDKIAEEF